MLCEMLGIINPAFLGQRGVREKREWWCYWGRRFLFHIDTGAPSEQGLESTGHSLVRGVCAISLRIGQRVEGRGETDVPLFGRIDIDTYVNVAYGGYDGGQRFDVVLELSGCLRTYGLRHVVAELEHDNVLHRVG